MVRSGVSAASLFLLLGAACGDRSPTTLAPTASASSVAIASGSAAPSGSATAASSAAQRPNQRVVAKALARGRELAQDGKWVDAVKAFKEATTADPENPICYAELGWAELQGADIEAAGSSTQRGLELVRDAKTKASLLYNRGRVEEAKGDKAAAQKSYEASLALRPNDAVQKRLESLGGKAPAAAPIARPPTCAKTFATVAAACDCLVTERASFGLSKEDEASCAAVEVESAGSTRPLEIVRVSAGAESVLWVLVDVKGRLQPAATIEGEVLPKKLLEPIKGDATIASVLFERTSTASGKTVRTTAELLCVLGDRKGAPGCPLEVPHAVAELKEKKPDADRTVTFSRTVKADGTVLVKKQAGPKDLVPSGALGQKSLAAIE
jgi:tetratricopeptide (TPR) repeat protein